MQSINVINQSINQSTRDPSINLIREQLKDVVKWRVRRAINVVRLSIEKITEI